MRRQNDDLNKGVALRYNLLAVYLRLVKNSLQVMPIKNYLVLTFLHGAAFGDKQLQLFD